MSRFLFHLHQVVDVICVEHKRLFAYHVRTQSQSIPYKRVVRIIWCTNSGPIKFVVSMHLLRAESVKLLLLSKERTIRKRTVQSSHTVKLVIRHHQVITCIGNSLNVSWSNVPRGTNQCKILHNNIYII